MSYTRTISRTVYVNYSGSVSYPASQHGGTVSYSGTATETVHVNVHVDTEPFDDAVDNVNAHVNVLTGAVAATHAAQVESIRENSRRIGDTIVQGFFKTVRSDISQQMAALQSQIDSLLVHLRELSLRCTGKMKTMQTDYTRICAHYSKIFEDLNGELDSRVHAIDSPVFSAVTAASEVTSSASGDSIGTAVLGGSENSRLHALMSASHAKQMAAKAIDGCSAFLRSHAMTDRLLAECLAPGNRHSRRAAPYCITEVADSPHQTSRHIYASPLLADIDEQRLEQAADHLKWNRPIAHADRDAITNYYNAEVARLTSEAATEHDRRVARLAGSLFDIAEAAVPGQ